MKHFLLKFNAGVEIGARLAYEGHYARTNEKKIADIVSDEINHRNSLEMMLKQLGEETSPAIDGCFALIGNSIKYLCRFMPLKSLDVVARLMEKFAISNYDKLAQMYPQYKTNLEEMAKAERDHEEYFRLGPNIYHLSKALTGGSLGQGSALQFEVLDTSKLEWVTFKDEHLKLWKDSVKK